MGSEQPGYNPSIQNGLNKQGQVADTLDKDMMDAQISAQDADLSFANSYTHIFTLDSTVVRIKKKTSCGRWG